ncbi:hypothetical protein PLICRDRAFT_172222 [Plicaturopsis crispa FD-325 SS-3]|nr:hypothetical protein PLICRDRAFT_172222 [Plicaturopsis crispa FD-325 SS-3]
MSVNETKEERAQESPLRRPAVVQRAHPPRLQHSPSLPNLWLPPHYGPIPPHLAERSLKDLTRPRTPPSLTSESGSSSSSPLKSTVVSSGEPASNSCSEAPSLSSTKKSHQQHKLHKHSLSHAHNLLTPPLTPSSSLRSGSSRGTSNNEPEEVKSDDASGAEKEVEDEFPASRFLLIRNVPKEMPTDALKRAIFAALPHTVLSPPDASVRALSSTFSALDIAEGSSRSRPARIATADDAIKGMYVTLQREHGIVVLAFYDLLVAGRAKRAIERAVDHGADHEDSEYRRAVGNEGASPEKRLLCEFISPDKLSELIGQSKFVTETEGHFRVSVGPVDATDRLVTGSAGNATRHSFIASATIRDILRGFGWICAFGGGDESSLGADGGQVFHAEYCDIRHADDAYAALNGKVVSGVKLRLFGREFKSKPIAPNLSTPLERDGNPQTPTRSTVPFPSAPPHDHLQLSNAPHTFIPQTNEDVRLRSISAGRPTDAAPAPHPSACLYSSPDSYQVSPETHSRHTSNHLFFDSTGKPHKVFLSSSQNDAQAIQERPGMLSIDVEQDAPPMHTQSQHPPFSAFCGNSEPSGLVSYYNNYPQQASPPAYAMPPTPISPSLQFPMPPVPVAPATSTTYAYDSELLQHPHWSFENAMMMAAQANGGEYYYPGGGLYYQQQQQAQYPAPPRLDLVPRHDLQYPAQQQPEYPQTPAHAPPSPTSPVDAQLRNQPENNQLNLEKIEMGQDMRTTVMIKNIPNKMSDVDLKKYIDRVCPRKIDFLYLRMDFQNGCNVGYAFVNFIGVEDLLHFANATLGVKWNMFSSEKVLQMSYANFQGKEALVEKFKNSCIMNEREAWRPKIFYSDPGPNQGLVEPFPEPTHRGRQERSSYNRSALFVPGRNNNVSLQQQQQHRYNRRS